MNRASWHITLPNLEATAALGRVLGGALRPGEHVALVGGLGAGKTTLCHSLAEGFGVADLREVASPTYAYAHVYGGPKGSLHHLDFYRLGDVDTAYGLGLDDLLNDPAAPCMVEWADLFAPLLKPEALWLTLTRTPGSPERALHMVAPLQRAQELSPLLPPWIGRYDVVGPAAAL
jgi:tRNA threonylcarbamoyladenosine biosynthesis protein TsaE